MQEGFDINTVNIMIPDFVPYVGTAFGLGLLLGLEREWHRHEAGVKTHSLVAVGAAIFAWLSFAFHDNGRVAAQVVTGIGFIGAGAIMRDGGHVKGLTTAATLWCAAAIGMLCGYGRLVEASIAAAAVILTNVVLLPLEVWFEKRRQASLKSLNQ
ncbi:MAG TPA: MgtC/SapB family protein [Bryobacteraceae bacterium]|nr:MgtC/SapB family protein [Bryobacteraceae bacterium]